MEVRRRESPEKRSLRKIRQRAQLLFLPHKCSCHRRLKVNWLPFWLPVVRRNSTLTEEKKKSHVAESEEKERKNPLNSPIVFI